jgi:hypothetical protein
MQKAPVEFVVGSLRLVRTTEDRALYTCKTPRRLARGILAVALCVAMVFLAFRVANAIGGVFGWIVAVVPLLGALILGSGGVLDIMTRPLFHLEVDRRARTLALAVPMEQGQALAKIGFDEVLTVDISERRPLPGVRGMTRWNVTLPLSNGRKIGLGLTEDGAEAERMAATFSELLKVGITRSLQESREA